MEAILELLVVLALVVMAGLLDLVTKVDSLERDLVEGLVLMEDRSDSVTKVDKVDSQQEPEERVVASPVVKDSFNGSPRSGLNGSGRWNNFNRDAAVSENDDTEASTAVNDEDEQTTTFGGYGDVSGAGFPTNANRRLGQ
uniref:Uncharacterized protein n=1 Tax=Anopheles dirus TaxID=7168 RepID=A0A182NIH2_9DIPT